MIANAFPGDKIVGEESAAELRQPANSALRERVVSLANEALTSDLALGDNAQWGIGPGKLRTAEELLDAIDLGNYEGGKSGRAHIFYFFYPYHFSLTFSYRSCVYVGLCLALLHCRHVDTRSHRRDARLPSRRAVRSLPCILARFASPGRRNGLPEPACRFQIA